MVVNGCIPFWIKPSFLGPLLNWQLIGVFIINIVIILWMFYRYIKKDETIPYGCLISVVAIYFTVFYSDMFHRMCDVQVMIEILVKRTVVVLVVAGISFAAAKIVKVMIDKKNT